MEALGRLGHRIKTFPRPQTKLSKIETGEIMDCISHALVGITLYQTRRKRLGHSPALLWAALIGSEMPDADILYRVDGTMTYLLNHRGISHSLTGLFLLTVLLTYLLHHRYPATPAGKIFYWSGSAGLIHILLDAANTWGTRIWFPFSKVWVAWDLLPFTDPLLIFCGAAGLVAGCLDGPNRRRYALAACLLFTFYAGGRAVLHQYLLRELELQYVSLSLEKVSVLPTMNPLRWQGVLETKTSVVLGNINTKTRQLDCTDWYPVTEDPLLASCRANESLAPSLPFFRYPALSLKQEAGKNIIVVADLYFYANPHRQASFELRQDGTIVRLRQKKLLPVQ